MAFADVHIHALYGTDDGARDEAHMLSMIRASYDDGVRLLCLTPHFHPGYYGNNAERSLIAFRTLRAHCREAFPDLHLLLANELFYSKDCVSWLKNGACRTIGQTKYVLVDFSDSTPANDITDGLFNLLRGGYLPILAHAERYRMLRMRHVYKMLDGGVLLQMDAQSLFGQFGFAARSRARKLLARRLVCFMGSDAHGMKSRPPGIGAAYRWIVEKCGAEYADEVCYNNAAELLFCDVSKEV